MSTAAERIALIRRINDRLAPDGQRLVRRSSHLGDFCILSGPPANPFVHAAHVHLEELARELGVLEANEKAAE